MRNAGRGAGSGVWWSLTAAAAIALALPATAQQTGTSAPPQPRPAQIQRATPPSADADALAGRPPTAPQTQTPEAVPEAAPLLVAPSTSAAGAEALAQAVLTVDQEAIYRQSAWGHRAEREITAQSQQVAADNDTAFAALVADEDALTAARATLDPEEFKRRAAAFDERVTTVRKERDAALADLSHMIERDRALFFQSAAPVIGRLMEARKALVVLDQRTVLISAQAIDVTDATIAALDASLGDGSAVVAAAIEAEQRAADAARIAPKPPGATGSDLDGPSPVEPAPATSSDGGPATPATQGTSP